ncbi:MAG: nuclear transport factor 2 family protein [Pseudomonadota bacterium]
MGEREALLTRLYEAYNRKDIDAVVDVLHADVDWPNLFGEGRRRGHAAVRAMWRDQFARIDPEATPISFTENRDGSVSVKINFIVRNLDGRIFTDEIATNTYRFRDDKVVRMDWG